MSNDPNCPLGSALTPEQSIAVDQEALRMLRRVASEWHSRAVALGHDGVASMLDVVVGLQADRQLLSWLESSRARYYPLSGGWHVYADDHEHSKLGSGSTLREALAVAMEAAR